MNYNRINNLNQRQFDIVMKRECITVTDYFYRDVTYDIFCRRNNRGTNPQGKVRIFYAKTTPISIGTMFILNGECFLVTSQDNIESDVYWTSMATKCDNYLSVMWNNGNFVSVPCVTISDKYTLDKGSVINLISGSVNIITGLNQYSKGIEIGDNFWVYGGYYEVGNFFYNDGLAYIFMTREASPVGSYSLTYKGETAFDISTTSTYQMSFLALNNMSPVEDATLTYVSSNETIATVDENGLVTFLATGKVSITATWKEGVKENSVCTVELTLSDSSVVIPTVSAKLSASSDKIKVGGSYKTMTTSFYDLDGNNVTSDTIANLTVDDFVWTCSIDGEDYTNNTDLVTWYRGSSDTVNKYKIKLANNRSYIGKTFTVNVVCTPLNVSASYDLLISA